ncbi:MAG: hypothetical protein ACD_81C00213G0005 [uncultured bacterium]|uniref:Peptidase E n=2 Tax=Candidatus Wolfeibacteriota TaxID=1752735 RepID=A0A0G1HBE3_9BACT|nr:MAG: hypothetical protein ACD_81C00213G0005 [uncultured bacterium]KKR12924.1 MAG: Peptidase E [Candidatus Wolfebacteria bacterium GW2011_GWC2_39_22]KKT43853.1 MAG: Peptidase E [Candidatus Wolfebacteria bacterium GW2011_GWE2_44_13]HBI25420.1 hypothetical protein [Candidatus Wolfebacteria bacterium]
MKLFLASAIDKTLPLLKPLLQNKAATKVLFIANASDNYPTKDAWWVSNDRIKFTELGYKLTDIDLRTTSTGALTQALEDTDILHIAGGSVFYLVGLLREKNLGQSIIDAVKSESVIYTGSSAGSMIISESLALFAFDEGEKEFLDTVPNRRGLGLINFGVIPHCNNPEFASEYAEIIKELSNHAEPLILLHDNQAIWVDNDTLKIISA